MEHVTRERYQRLGLLGLLLLAGLLLFSAFGTHLPSSLAGGAAPERTPAFTLQGDARKALLPGARAARLNLRVTNPSDDRLRITGLAVTVTRVSAPRATDRLPCTKTDFRVRQAPRYLSVVIAADSSATLRQLDVRRRSLPRIRMLNSDENQDGCQQSTLTLGYTASGRFRT